LVEAAKTDYLSRPTDRPAIKKYAERLLERGRPEDQDAAYTVLMKAFQETQEFRFRQAAGDIRLRQFRQKLESLRKAAEANSTDAEAKEAHDAARSEYAQLEIVEYKVRVENYPTDLILKFELGKRYFDQKQYEDAIGLFQEAKADAKNRAKV